MEQSNWPRLYARGFCLSPTAVDELDELPYFQRYDLTGASLYVDELTEIGVASYGDDWLVTLGKILPLSTGIIESRGADIAADLFALLQREGLAGVEAALYDLGGRHAVLIHRQGKTFAYNDAAGHRTVYFNAAQQRLASHFDMLHRLTDVTKLVCSMGSRHTTTSPDGMWDLTENPHIKALLPNHRLELSAGAQQRFGLVQPNPFRKLAWADRIEMIHQLWQEQLGQVFAMSPDQPVGVSLSGGLDSRTVLSQMRNHLHRTRAFTYTAANIASGTAPASFWQRTMVTDHNVLAQMQDHLPEDFHVLIRSTEKILTPQERATLARNAMRNHGWSFVKMYQEIFPDIKSIHVRGNFVEMGRFIRGRLDIPTKRERFARVIDEVMRRRKPHRKKYREFFWHKAQEFQYDRLHEDVEFTDAYHWENRSSRWYAEIANETDTVFDSIVPVNVRRIYELFLSPRVDVRVGTQLQRDLIHHAWPELLAYGINTEKDLYTSTLRQQLGRAAR